MVDRFSEIPIIQIPR